MIQNVETQLYLVSIRLQYNFAIEDLTIRFEMLSSNISRILTTWYAFLHSFVRGIPIWSLKQTPVDAMLESFKKLYPNT